MGQGDPRCKTRLNRKCVSHPAPSVLSLCQAFLSLSFVPQHIQITAALVLPHSSSRPPSTVLLEHTQLLKPHSLSSWASSVPWVSSTRGSTYRDTGGNYLTALRLWVHSILILPSLSRSLLPPVHPSKTSSRSPAVFSEAASLAGELLLS